MKRIGLIALIALPLLAACKHPEPQPDYGAVKQHAGQAFGTMDRDSQPLSNQ